MGDVYKAMNRAMRERGETPASSASEPAPPSEGSAPASPSTTDPEAPALPIAEVEAAARQPEEKPAFTSLPPVTPRTASTASAARPVRADERASKGHDQSDAPPSQKLENAPKPSKPTKPMAPTPTAAAMDRASELKASDRVPAEPVADIAPPAAARATSLNGYSPEVVVHHDRGSVITEQYRAIRTQILARARNRRLQLHVVTSSAPQEGKSVTTVNLGIAFSELRNQRSLLIEGDLRRPAFHKYFRRKPEPGLLHYLRGKTDDIDSIIHPSVHENLQIIPAGDREFNSSTELLSSPRMAQLLDRLRDRYEHIFIDTPPVITVTDACILGAMADETLLVVRLNRTPTEVVDRAKRLLRAANCDVAGVILTHMKFHIPNYLYRYV